ncbi:Nitrilase/cyanide hydratase and apolipoprotein N-acyltransferase [Fibrella aestuarina BUZ 2]|uniref:Nitrilase/cyanide hydratase and apolipoprotein N-acyltransferase n=1 Tax=Fibrella aestuarina BUZ 2 TaxID=1166018 RepID=I0K9E6_9BACT|nr:nitrilase-related carbon-nitrogen hydrolase [Fibrella aestuarina]CCH00749.1 Nitrilase/cyanide hydratase and apolipoprotein N-acyltransferase [Fibrella aestuarina BUZ 2]
MYKALALQLTCQTINHTTTRDEAEAVMLASIDRIDKQIEASIGFAGRDTLLVVVPEYFLTGFPQTESLIDWRDKAALELDGRIYEALGAMVQKHKIYFSGNAYELDPHFPDLYFQTSFIMGPNGDVILRYRRLNAMLTPTPHDVWAYYLEAYGYDAVFPVAKTNIGNLACIASEEILYPEVARCLAMRGAEIFLHSTSEAGSPMLTPRNVAKMARATENMGYVVSANSAGVAGINIPMGSLDTGSKIVDYKGLVLAEAGAGESMVANADIDLNALRQFRQRTGPANLLSRQRFELYADSYAQHSYYPPNTLLAETPDRAVFQRNQQDVIKRLFEK